MTIIGMNFNRINVTRADKVKGNLEVVHNVFLSGVEEESMAAGDKKTQALKFSFEFSVKYEPKAGQITLGGYVLYMVTAEQAKEILEKWNTQKKVSKELTKNVLAHAFTRCNIESAVLSKEVGLPPPFPIPRLRTEKMGGEGDAQAK